MWAFLHLAVLSTHRDLVGQEEQCIIIICRRRRSRLVATLLFGEKETHVRIVSSPRSLYVPMLSVLLNCNECLRAGQIIRKVVTRTNYDRHRRLWAAKQFCFTSPPPCYNKITESICTTNTDTHQPPSPSPLQIIGVHLVNYTQRWSRRLPGLIWSLNDFVFSH